MKRKERNIEEELKKSFERWEYLYVHGGSDPYNSDGCNLDLVRNHIIYYKTQLKKQNHFPEIYYKETPPEVDRDYMAQAEEIKENASKSLRTYLANEDYIYLLNNIQNMNPKQLEETHVGNVLGYVARLRQCILSNDLVTMRGYENPKHYLERFHECRVKLESMTEESYYSPRFEPGCQVPGQISFEDLENEV